MPSRIYIGESEINTEIGPKINDKIGIDIVSTNRVLRSGSINKVKISSFETNMGSALGISTENFFLPFFEWGRVEVERHNLKIKNLYIFSIFLTLYFFQWNQSERVQTEN